MNDETKTQAELIAELAALRRQVAELQANAGPAGASTDLSGPLALLQAVTDIAQTALTILDLEELTSQVVMLIQEQFGLESALFLVDATERQAVLQAGTERFGQWLEVGDPTLVGQCLSRRQLQLAPSGLELALPLLSGGDLIGALFLQSDQPTSFRAEFLPVLQVLADQLAMSLQASQMVGQARQRTFLLESLAQAQAALTQAANEVEILDAVAMAMDWDPRATLSLHYLDVDESDQPVVATLVALWQSGLAVEDSPLLHQRVAVAELPLAALWVATAGEIIVLADLQTDPRVAEADRAALPARTAILLPLRGAGRWQGLVMMSWAELRELTADEQLMLRQLVGPLATVVTSRRVFLARQQAQAQLDKRARQLATAAEVSRAASSLLNLDELLPQVVTLIQQQFDLYYVGIFLLDESARWAVLRAGTGEAGRIMLERGHRFEVGSASMIGSCVAQGQARIALDVGEEAVRFANPLLPETHSEVALPLISRGQVVGAMSIQSTETAAFSQEDITVLQTMADQLANAIQNARLFTQAQAERTRLATLYEVSRSFSATTTVDEMAQVVLKMGPYVGASSLDLLLFDVGGGPRLYSSEPERSGMTPAQSRDYYQLVTTSGVEHWVIANRQAALIEDTRADSRWLVLAGHEEKDLIRSAICLPLLDRQGHLLGTLSYNYSQPHAFGQDEVQLAEEIGARFIGVLEARWLFEQTQNTLTEVEMVYKASQAISRAESVEDIVRSAAGLAEFVGLWGATIRVMTRWDDAGVPIEQDLYTFSPDQGPEVRRMPGVPVTRESLLAFRNLPDGVLVYRDCEDPDEPMPEPVRVNLRKQGNRGALTVELRGRQRTLGFLSFSSRQSLSNLPERYFHVLTRTLVDQIALALEGRLLLTQLQESEARFRDVALSSGDWVWETDLAGRYTYCSERVVDVLGYTPAEVLGKTVFDFMPADEAATLRPVFEAIATNRDEIHDLENRALTQTGQEVVLLTTAVPILDVHGHLVGYRGVNENITDRKQAERALQEQINRLQIFLDAIPNPIFVKDVNGVYTVCNRAFEEYMGRPREQIIGLSAFDLASPELAAKYHAMDLALLQSPGHQVYESQVRYADGTLHDVIFNKATFTDLTGNLMGLVGVIVDITERKHAERERERMLVDLERRAVRLQTAAEVSRTASALLNLEELLPQAVALVQERFGLYYAGIFLVDDTGQWAVLRAGTGEAGRIMLERHHKFAVGSASMIGSCVAQGKARIALDVGAEAVRFVNPLLPETRSEMALPLISRGQVIGAMTIQSTEAAAFSNEDITILQTVADKLADAIANARLYAEAERRLQELQTLQRMYTGEVWQEYAAHQPQLNYAYDLSQVVPVQDLPPLLPPSLPEAGRVLARTGGDGATLIAPIALRGEPVGLLSFEEPEQPREWSEDDLALVEAVREQLNLALENRLLFEQTQQALAQTHVLYEIGRQMATARSMQEVLQAAVDGLARQLRVDRIIGGLLEPIQAPEVIRGIAGWQREGEVHLGALPLSQVPQLYAALREGTAVYVTDLLTDTREEVDGALRLLYGQLGLRGMATVGLRVLGRAYAGLMIQTAEPHDFSENERRFCESVAQQAATALANLALLADSQAEVERRALLNEVQQTASRSLEPTVLMQDVGRLIAERLAMPVLLWGWDERLTHLIAAYSPAGRRIAMEDFSCRPEDIPGMSWAVRTGEPMLVQNLEQKLSTDTMCRLDAALKLQELYVVPLTARGRVQGVLVLGRQPDHPPIDENEVAFLQLAAINVGIALENARLYQEAQETAEKLQEVDRLKNQFLASMSHELRTPLNSIIGFSRVILKGIDGPLTEMQQTDLQAIYESGNHLLGLINDILDFSKIEAGKMELIFEPTNLKEAIKGVMTTAIALVKDRPIELQQNIPADLPIVVADGRRIRQIILNLVGNAAKFTEQGFIRVSASYDAKEVVICVEDTGIGIPPDKVGSIFEAFTQVDSSSTRRYGGTGLGLPITKRFVEMHGGRIWVESKVGEGSSFYVALPIEGPAAAASEEESEEELPVVASTSRVILTVDDDEGVITLFRRYLEKQNYQVVGLTSGDRVVQEARRLKPYAITLDILMPGKDGWQILQDLKSEPETRNIPVIVCSISPDVGRGLSMGISDYLVKPIVEQDLLAALARLEHGDEERRVLVVDDNPDDRKLLHRILRDAGYTVYEAPGGAEAIAMIYESPPDVVVLDLMMPEMDGFAVLENLKSNEGTRDIPVIVVTAKELTSSEREELQVQVEALLQKGLFDQEQLLKDVTAALARLEKGH